MRNTPSKDTTEGAGKGRAAEEERDTILAFIALVPHREVVDDAGEQARFRDTQAMLVSKVLTVGSGLILTRIEQRKIQRGFWSHP